MNTAFLRTVLLVSVCCLAGVVQAQSPTPFGTPSLLPANGGFPGWQSSRVGEILATPAPQHAPQYAPAASRQAAASYHSRPQLPPALPAGGVRNPATPTPKTFIPMPHQGSRQSLLQTPGATAPTVDGPGPLGAGVSSVDSWGEDCSEPSCCLPSFCGPTWYAAANGLLFTRNRPRFSQVSYDDTNLVGQVLSTDSGLGRWDAGPELRLGWYINPCWAVEFTYWGIYGDDVESTVLASDLVGNLNTVFDFRPLNIGASNVNDLFDAAQIHRIRRDYDVNNLEVNLISGRLPSWDGNCLRVSYLGGFRYLRFAEDFQYASADANPVFGADPANEVFYDIDVRNNLWGAQLGGRADWFWTPRFSLYTATKFGIYANYMEHRSGIYNVNGIATVGPGNPLAGGAYNIASDKTITSFIGELDLGTNFQFTPHWSAVLGYRVLAVSGMAYATDQIPSNFADLPGVAGIDSNADLVLHGGYAGIVLSW